MDKDLISREWLKDAFDNLCCHNCKMCRNFRNEDSFYKCNLIDNAPTVKEIEKPFITECRNTAIKKNLPLYFVYYEEIGVFEVYITETKELFEKRHCAKHLPNYEFNEIVNNYLDNYTDWKKNEEVKNNG